MINIIRKGIYPIPHEARKCPVCGKLREESLFTLENEQYANPVRNQMSMEDDFDFAQKYPTFICDNCKTMWQYLGEKKEENK